MEPIIGMRHKEVSESRSMAKATNNKERSKFHLMPLAHEPLLHLANIPQALEMNVNTCEETLSGSNALHMGRHITILVAPKNA